MAQKVHLVKMEDGSDPRLVAGRWIAVECDCCMDVNIFKVPFGMAFGDANGGPVVPTGRWVQAEGVRAEVWASAGDVN